MLTPTLNPYKEEYDIQQESSGSSFLNDSLETSNIDYYIMYNDKIIYRSEKNNYELILGRLESLSDIDYFKEIKRSNNLISKLFNEPDVAISETLKDEIISDFNAIYNYFSRKEISKFGVEFIDENELFIKIRYQDLSIYITLDYIEVDDRYSVTLIKNKKIEKIINESSIEKFILALKSYILNVQT